jgi:hypothetical protein
MARTKIIFYGTDESQTQEHKATCYVNADNEIYMEIDMGDMPAFICFDKSTAIKFAKTLRTHINLIEDKEVYNG